MTDIRKPSNFGNVVAHGVDLVNVADFAHLVNEQASDYLDRYFTAAELAAANEGGNRIEKLAARFAIKEAVLKALGKGWGDGTAFTDVEVVSQQTGAPSVVLHRHLVAVAEERKIGVWLVSASHTDSMAIASVIALV